MSGMKKANSKLSPLKSKIPINLDKTLIMQTVQDSYNSMLLNFR